MKEYFEGKSELWIEVHRNDWESLEQFCVVFFDSFCSQEKQDGLKGKSMTDMPYKGIIRKFAIISSNYIIKHSF